jgi:cyanophycin synthetase
MHTVHDLAKVKSVVPRSTFDDGYAILNADDDVVFAIKDELDCNIALFSTQENNERVISHCEAGGWAAIIEKGNFTICQGEWRIRVAKVNEVPLTFNGRAIAMIKNILPAILAASLSNFDTKIIRKALQSFKPGPDLTPGRMNVFRFRNFEVMVDYVHNTDGFIQLKEFINNVNAKRKIMIIGCAGDRRDDDIRNMGKYAAEMFDEIIIRHDKDGRGRTNEELTRLITEGIESVKPGALKNIISDEKEALKYAIDNADAGTFIVVASDDIQNTINFVQHKQKQHVPEIAHEEI